MNKIYLNSCDGRIFVLDEQNANFKPLASRTLLRSNIKVKKLSSCTWCFWCILANFEVSLFVFKSDTPIKCQVETYENQRRYNFFKKDAFVENLLPTDRHNFSSEDGTQHLPKDKFELPSCAWSWDGEWFTEATTGWEYALDFPAKYHDAYFPSALVRRKKWLRNRTFIAFNHFIRIDLPKCHDCIIDVSVGGWDIPYMSEKGYLSVWAVSNTGKVFFRENVSYKNVEGTRWRDFDYGGVFSCSCSSNGEAWFIKWDGGIVVRVGISRDTPYGTHWKEIHNPTTDIGLRQISVGLKAVWALDNQGSVYYRKGLGDESNQHGTKWIHVTGTMNSISVSNVDQLWAIDSDHYLCYREDICDSSPSGKNWRRIELPIKSNESEDYEPDVYHVEEKEETIRTKPISSILDISNIETPNTENEILNTVIESEVSIYDSIYDHNTSCYDNQEEKNGEINKNDKNKLDTVSFKSNTSSIKTNFENLQSNLKNLDFLIEKLKENGIEKQERTTTANPATRPDSATSSLSTTDNTEDSPVSQLNSTPSYQHETVSISESIDLYDNILFKWCDASQCQIISNNVPAIWLDPNLLVYKSTQCEWRNDILNNLKKRNENEIVDEKYKQPFEKDSNWSQVDEFKFLQNGNNMKICILEIKPSNINSNGQLHIKILKGINKIKKEIILNFTDILCVTRYNYQEKPKNAIFAIFQKSDIMRPLLFTSSSEKKIADWIRQISFYCCKLWSFNDIRKTVVMTNTDGNVYLGCIQNDSIKFIKQINGHFKHIERHSNGFIMGIGFNGKIWVLNGLSPINSVMHDSNGSFIQTDELEYHTYENQRWNVLTSFSVIGFPTDRYMWSDESGKEKRNKEDFNLPSGVFQWISEWQVDYSVQGGTDKDGWQYAIDFPLKYHATRNVFSDFVRRRKWTRKCRVRLQSLWVEVPQAHQITSISFDQEDGEHVCVWATEADGNVLCALVDPLQTNIQCKWRYVTSEIPFKYISIGKDFRVYGLSVNGHVYFRIGVNPKLNICGTSWSLLESSSDLKFKQINAGYNVLWAVNEENEAYYRESITKLYPEGTVWTKQSEYIKYVSVNKKNEVYGIESSATLDKRANVLLYRDGITESNPKGTSWKPLLSLKWSMVSNRGL